MAWKSFARQVYYVARQYRGSVGFRFHTWRVNRWIRNARNKPYRTILEIYEADGKPYEYQADHDRDVAHWAIKFVLDKTFEQPEGWQADEVFNTAAAVHDRSLFDDFRTDENYRPVIIPLLLQIINEPDLDRPDLWAEIIGKFGPAAKEALPALLTIVAKRPYYNEESRIPNAIRALGGQPPEKTPLTSTPLGVPVDLSHAHLFEVRSIDRETWCDVCRQPANDFVRWCEACGIVVHTWCAKDA